jgi:hypothetical protein
MAGTPAEHTQFAQQHHQQQHPQLQQAGQSISKPNPSTISTAAAAWPFSISSSSTARIQQSVMFAAAPDSHLFQHFMDRTAMMLAQTEALRSSNTKYIALPPR